MEKDKHLNVNGNITSEEAADFETSKVVEASTSKASEETVDIETCDSDTAQQKNTSENGVQSSIVTNESKESLDGTISAVEFLDYQTRLEEEAAQVLPGKFDSCTWEKGYIRQPVYVCLTCSRECAEDKDVSTLAKNLAINGNDDNSESDPRMPTDEVQSIKKDAGDTICHVDKNWSRRVCPGLPKEKPNDPEICPPGFNPAGICYSCSISCHSDHDVIELFTKRHFSCDCGTKRLVLGKTDRKCSLKKQIDNISMIVNTENQYSHNFWGYYCRRRAFISNIVIIKFLKYQVSIVWCDTFYEPANESRDMIECFLCNEWYHDSCIGVMPADEDYDEYICRECISKCTVLQGIQSAHVTKGVVMLTSEGENKGIEVVTSLKPSSKSDKNSGDFEADKSVRTNEICESGNGDDNEKCKTILMNCKDEKVDLFVKEGWVDDICKCKKCQKMLLDAGLGFIYTDEKIYEPEPDETRTESLYEAGIKEFSRFDHSKAIASSATFRGFCDKVKDFLKPFADNKRVVSDKDISQLFQNLSANRKRQRFQ
ncbi:putative E3 ubiquitin-protein ligase UBR7 [Zancudomyces culisetae]|uniref:Putative E3 ubiquitin-protein ligase UBR7 n=1 Tax=Zancudomyces culisetae TaxID=1213189 RepID=A0A1R1PU97_ZANCU|nr:putative E3 ubiquitin-protein ligase UBR7 [Zancudomyces culisetae]|eukprot:OMH84566.1 putative E3 ubiquitin-protein ligase UBR7 [Zancudomyces culisetae]